MIEENISIFDYPKIETDIEVKRLTKKTFGIILLIIVAISFFSLAFISNSKPDISKNHKESDCQ